MLSFGAKAFIHYVSQSLMIWKTSKFMSLQFLIPRFDFFNIWKDFVRSHLQQGYITYNQVYNASLHQILESIEQSSCLIHTGTKQKVNNLEKLVLKLIQLHCWYRTCSVKALFVHQQKWWKYTFFKVLLESFDIDT